MRDIGLMLAVAMFAASFAILVRPMISVLRRRFDPPTIPPAVSPAPPVIVSPEEHRAMLINHRADQLRGFISRWPAVPPSVTHMVLTLNYDDGQSFTVEMETSHNRREKFDTRGNA